jgi:hypothetical protein
MAEHAGRTSGVHAAAETVAQTAADVKRAPGK